MWRIAFVWKKECRLGNTGIEFCVGSNKTRKKWWSGKANMKIFCGY
jgi:hypothetical protein